MESTRLSLFYYDVIRERCANCGSEKFHFVPIGAAAPEAGDCMQCGTEREIADLSETSIRRLVTTRQEMSVTTLIPTARE
jgi:hypothetical protein